MDGLSVEIVAGQLLDPAEQPAPPASTRPIPELGDVLCQVCGRHTNCEVQNDLVDIPYAFYFQKGAEPRQYKAVICFECYMNGILAGASVAHDAIQRVSDETGIPVMDLHCGPACGAGGAPATHCGPEGGLAEERPIPDELPRGSANG